MKLLQLLRRSVSWSDTRRRYYFALPYKGLDYLADHFDYIDRIQRLGRRCSQWYQVVFCIAVLLYKALCYGVQWQVSYSEEEEVLFMHVYGMLDMPRECDLVTIVFCLQVAHFLYVLYFRNVNEATLLMKSLLIDRQDTFFVHKHERRRAAPPPPPPPPPRRCHGKASRSVTLRQQVTRHALTLMNLLQAHTVIIMSFIIFSKFHIAFYLRAHWSQIFAGGFWLGLLKLVTLAVNLFVHDVFLVQYGRVMVLASTFLATLSTIIFLKFDQLNQLLTTRSTKSSVALRWSKLSYFARAHTQTFRFTMRGKENYEQMVSFYIVATVPLNVYLTVSSINGTFSETANYIYVPIVISQFCILCALHYICGRYSKKIQGCGKRLLHVAAQPAQPWPSTRERLMVSNYVGKFHRRSHQYGFEYAYIGLMSMFGFVKFLILYSEFILFTHQRLNFDPITRRRL